MKVLLILAVGCLAASASSFDKEDSRINGENGWYVPRQNGSFYWLDKKEAESYLEDEENARGLSLTPVNFYLYTRSNPSRSQEIKTDSIKSVKNSDFDPRRPTRIVIHGFIQGRLSGMNKQIRKAWLKKEDCNVIIVDWARARSLDYISSVLAVPKVGKKVANMIDNLVEYHGMSLETLHVIGHSLGAHVAGYAAKNMNAGQIHTIIGLDPALPMFSYDKPKKRLNSNDAFYVETIQTNGGGFGFLTPIGKSAFYPNGGVSQPGCLTGICDHERSIEYYIECVTNDNFGAINCENLEDAVGKNCGNTYSSVRMGAEKNSYMAAGIFNVPVNKKTPFGMLSHNELQEE